MNDVEENEVVLKMPEVGKLYVERIFHGDVLIPDSFEPGILMVTEVKRFTTFREKWVGKTVDKIFVTVEKLEISFIDQDEAVHKFSSSFQYQLEWWSKRMMEVGQQT